MQSEWREIELGALVRLQRGHDLTSEQRNDGPYPVMGSAGPNGTHALAKARGPGVVIGRSGASAGRVHYVLVDYWPHNTCLYVTDFLGNDPRFVYYLLGSHRLADYNSGSAQPSLNRNFIYTKPVRVPSLEVQKDTSALLGGLDDRIDLLRKTNTTLEAIAQALFKSWFVDFDPVRAKAEGREPEGMDAATAALFPSEFEESELGLIPKGCSVVPFSSQFDFTMGQSPPGSTYNTNRAGTPFFQGCTDFGEVYPSHRVFCSQPTRFAHSGDVLMSVRAPVGALNIANVDCSIGRGLCAIRHKSGPTGLTHEFVKACITRIENAAGEGALFKSLSKQQLASLPIVKVDRAVLDAAASFLGPLMERRLLNSQQAETLRMLRDTLLPRLISGKLRLSGTEAALARVPT